MKPPKMLASKRLNCAAIHGHAPFAMVRTSNDLIGCHAVKAGDVGKDQSLAHPPTSDRRRSVHAWPFAEQKSLERGRRMWQHILETLREMAQGNSTVDLSCVSSHRATPSGPSWGGGLTPPVARGCGSPAIIWTGPIYQRSDNWELNSAGYSAGCELYNDCF